MHLFVHAHFCLYANIHVPDYSFRLALMFYSIQFLLHSRFYALTSGWVGRFHSYAQ